MKNSLHLDSKSGAGGEARYAARHVPGHAARGVARDTAGYVARGAAKGTADDKEPILNKSVYYSRYYSPLDYFLERASRWVLVFAFLYMLAQIIRVVVR